MPNGYSYLQVLIVIAIISIIAAAASPYYLNFQTRQQLSSTADVFLSDIRYVQGKSMQREQDNQWGLHVNDADKEYVLFYGTTYNSGESNNIPVSYPGSVSISPDTDLVFDAITGIPATSVSFTLTSSAFSTESYTISINEEGTTEKN